LPSLPAGSAGRARNPRALAGFESCNSLSRRSFSRYRLADPRPPPAVTRATVNASSPAGDAFGYDVHSCACSSAINLKGFPTRAKTAQTAPRIDSELLVALERAFDLLAGTADKLLHEEGQPVTFLESREIEDIYNDAICELAPFETLIREARGAS